MLDIPRQSPVLRPSGRPIHGEMHTHYARDTPGDSHEPEQALRTTMCAMGRSAEDRADHDERRCHDQSALATESVAQDSDDHLADNVP